MQTNTNYVDYAKINQNNGNYAAVMNQLKLILVTGWSHTKGAPS